MKEKALNCAEQIEICSDFMQDEIHEENWQEVREYLTSILKDAARISGMLDKLQKRPSYDYNL